MQKPSQVYGRCSEGAERFPEGTQKEKGQEGEEEGDVILLMCFAIAQDTSTL